MYNDVRVLQTVELMTQVYVRLFQLHFGCQPVSLSPKSTHRALTTLNMHLTDDKLGMSSAACMQPVDLQQFVLILSDARVCHPADGNEACQSPLLVFFLLDGHLLAGADAAAVRGGAVLMPLLLLVVQHRVAMSPHKEKLIFLGCFLLQLQLPARKV